MSAATAAIDLPNSKTMPSAGDRPGSVHPFPIEIDEHLYVGNSGAVVVSAHFEQVTDGATFVALAAVLTDAALAGGGDGSDAKSKGWQE